MEEQAKNDQEQQQAEQASDSETQAEHNGSDETCHTKRESECDSDCGSDSDTDCGCDCGSECDCDCPCDIEVEHLEDGYRITIRGDKELVAKQRRVADAYVNFLREQKKARIWLPLPLRWLLRLLNCRK